MIQSASNILYIYFLLCLLIIVLPFPSAFRLSAMYVITFVSAIVFPIVFLLPIFPEVRLLISSVGFAIATLSAMSATFVPMMYLLLLGADLDAKMGIVMPNGRARGSGACVRARVRY